MNQMRESTSVVNRVQQLKEYPDRFYEQFRMSLATFHHFKDRYPNILDNTCSIFVIPISFIINAWFMLHQLNEEIFHIDR